jgi:hypothetical protein
MGFEKGGLSSSKTQMAPEHDRFDQASTLAEGHDPTGADPKLGKIMEENAKLANPLAGMGKGQLLAQADAFGRCRYLCLKEASSLISFIT